MSSELPFMFDGFDVYVWSLAGVATTGTSPAVLCDDVILKMHASQCS